MAELYQIREELYREFGGDMHAYFEHVRQLEAEEEARGRTIIRTPFKPRVHPGNVPDPVDPEWEDPIVAEVRRVREEIYDEFGGDMHAYFEHLREQTEEARKQGVKVIDQPLRKPDAA